LEKGPPFSVQAMNNTADHRLFSIARDQQNYTNIPKTESAHLVAV